MAPKETTCSIKYIYLNTHIRTGIIVGDNKCGMRRSGIVGAADFLNIGGQTLNNVKVEDSR